MVVEVVEAEVPAVMAEVVVATVGPFWLLPQAITTRSQWELVVLPVQDHQEVRVMEQLVEIQASGEVW